MDVSPPNQVIAHRKRVKNGAMTLIKVTVIAFVPLKDSVQIFSVFVVILLNVPSRTKASQCGLH